jgi:cell wall-associated NlpC family hydrolase
MSSRGFVDLLERVEFLKRVSRKNASVLDLTREARAAVARQARDLDRLRVRYSALARAALADRERADVIRGALLRRQEAQLRRRDGVVARLAAVRSRIGALERRHAAAARRERAARAAASAAPAARANPTSPAATGGGGADAVAKVVAAATQIASTPYVWGGGHGGASGGYDCSGSISYALAAAGLLSSPLDSTGFMSYGDAGPGRRITIYAHSGHAFMVVDGRRFDTSALSGGGTRWSSSMRSTAGFVARHPPGL